MPTFNIVFEGCCHGSLDDIYAGIIALNKPVDLVLIGGDFQAVRAFSDLQCMAVPPKYRQLGDFKKYYDGHAKAPFLTIFIGGNHEASNYLQELYYGGWVAPNIYYLGAAGAVTFKNSLRIAGLSGIYNGRDYKAARTEIVPYNNQSMRTIYHIRDHEVDKLKMLQSQRIDVMMSHDWPAGIEHYGNLKELLQKKKYFKQDIERGELGSPPAMEILQTVKPGHWLSAHLHVKFTAKVRHIEKKSTRRKANAKINEDEIMLDELQPTNAEEIVLDITENTDEIVLDEEAENKDEIVLDVAESPKDVEVQSGENLDEISLEVEPSESKANGDEIDLGLDMDMTSAIPEASESTPSKKPHFHATQFLALDKCLPRRQFLEYLTIKVPETPPASKSSSKKKRRRSSTGSNSSSGGTSTTARYHPDLAYDPDWLAITKTMNPFYPHPDSKTPDWESEEIRKALEENKEWVNLNIVDKSMLAVPLNFKRNDRLQKEPRNARPQFLRNEQTDRFCSLLGIDNQVLVQQGVSATAAEPVETNVGSALPELPLSLPSKPTVAAPLKPVVEATSSTEYPQYEPSSDEEAPATSNPTPVSTFDGPNYEANSSSDSD